MLLDDVKYWLAFSLVPNIGAKRLVHLYERFGDLREAWHAPQAALRSSELGKKTLDSLLKLRQSLDLDAAMDQVKKADAWLLTMADERYPAALRRMDDAPSLLYVRGRILSQDDLALAVVGTRKATKAGRDITFDLSQQLAAQGVTIISGLAHGVDTAAHQGALAAHGRTIAVMGCGVDVLYPAENRDLAQKIMRHGAIISEFPLGTQPRPSHFPRRNRIISGLSLGVLVTEAPENSGALITAHLAADQGREVFAVPGNIYNKMARGANRLIQDGAKLVLDVKDVLDELNIAHDVVQTQVRTEQVAPSNPVERALLDLLGADPIHIDEIARMSQMEIAQVTSTLTLLELKGLAQMVGHMQYSRANNRD